LSEVRVSEVAAFFRYIVPGISLVCFVILTIPWQYLEDSISLLDGSLLAVAITSGFILLGWVSYHAIYPLWRHLLSVLHLYPRSRVICNLKEMIENKNLTPNDFWSFFLWNHCKDSIRERIKLLANHGHSLYMVSFSFFVFPLVYTASKFASDPNTVLAHTFSSLLPENASPSVIPPLEFFFVMLSCVIGAILLYFGFRRIQYAESIQWLLFKSRGKEISEILQKLCTND